MSKVAVFPDGFAILGDSASIFTVDLAHRLCDVMFPGCPKMVVTDPPYGNILDVSWDRQDNDDDQFAKWMADWTRWWTDPLPTGSATYVWGAIGKPGFRPFMKYIPLVEQQTELKCHNVITWGKRRAYGLSHNYLFTREELAYFVKGPDPRKPLVFNVPYLETKRGYAGFDKTHPAKSEFFRRSNVWTDVNELFRDKLHVAQKPDRVCEIPIEVSSHPGHVVLDPFAGSGSTAVAARKLGRFFGLVEADPSEWVVLVNRLGDHQEIDA